MKSILCLITSLTSHKLSTAFKVYTLLVMKINSDGHKKISPKTDVILL
jgi:hypothetical protein